MTARDGAPAPRLDRTGPLGEPDRVNARNVILALGFVALGMALIVLARPLAPPRHIPYGPGLFPTIVGGGMVVFGAVAALRAGRGSDPGPRPAAPPTAEGRLAALAFVIATLSFVLLVPVAGFLVVMPLLLGGLIGLRCKRWLGALGIGVIVTLALHALFHDVLRVPLPWGALAPLAGLLTWR